MIDQSVEKLVVITGATKGLGRELALTFGLAGYYVIGLFHSDLHAAQRMSEEFKTRELQGRFIKLDVSRDDAAELCSTQPIPSASELVLINNAAPKFIPEPMHLLEWEDFQSQLDVGIKGTFLLSRIMVKRMLRARRGTIVNILSSAIEGNPPKGFAAYATAKFALQGLTKALAGEYTHRNLRVFSVSPGFMHTALTSDWDPRLTKLIINSSERVRDPIEVAKAILTLVLDQRTMGHGENYSLS